MLIPCSQELVGSNPTPRAYLGNLYDNLKSHRKSNYYRTTDLAQVSISDVKEKEKITIITKKIDSITKSCSKPYFNKILINLSKQSVDNANTICDYLIAEETEINIKNSTKEGRIKILVWLSAFHENKILFSKMTNQISIVYFQSIS